MEHKFVRPDIYDFFVTVQSDKCKEYYTENTPSQFNNILYQPVNTDFYEVGVAEIFLSCKKEEEEENKPVQSPTISSSEQTFFSNPGSDNLITVLKFKQTFLKFAKRNLNFVNFFEELKQFLNENQSEVGVNFSKEYVELGKPAKTILTFNDPTGEYSLQVQPQWAEAFGFRQHTFNAGRFVSENPQSEESFAKILLGSVMSLTFSRWEIKSVPVQEPSEFDIEELVENLVDALREYNVRMPMLQYKQESRTRRVHIYLDNNLTIQFPVSVNRALGKPDNFRFNDNLSVVEFYVNIDVSQPAPVGPKKLPMIPGRQILITSNIIDPQMFANSHHYALRRFMKSELKDVEHLTFNPVHYVALAKKEVQSIQISLTDENNIPIETLDKATTVLLHFKRRF